MNNDAALIKNIVESTIKELNDMKMLKKKPMTSYQKTEQVLYSYNDYKKAVQDKEEKIKEIKKYGLSKRSGSIIPMPSGSPKNASEEEKEQEAIETIQKSIVLTKRYIAIIDDALEKLKDEPYYELIEMIYFEGKTIEKVANHFNVDISTVSRKKKILINKLSIYLFSDDVINELYA